MITTLTGENSFTLREAAAQLIDSFVAEHGELTLERLNGEEDDFAQIQQALNILPFLATQKLVVLRAPSKNKQFVEQFEQLLGALPDTTNVIIIEPKLDKRLNYYKFLKKETDFREYPELDHNALAGWLVSTVKKRGGSLNSSDARYMVERVSINQQLLAHELDKLLLYNPKITRQTVDLLTDPVPQSTIFQLLDAAFSGHTKEILNLYDQQRALKVEPQQIIALLTWQLHVVAIIKTSGDRNADQIAQEARMNPYVVRKSQSIARRLSLPELRKHVADLAVIDKRLKSTIISPDEALQHYLLTLKS